jgi:hypothetical protein
MIAKIKPDELKVFQVLSHPISCAEVLFHDFDALGIWDREKFGQIRKYQYPMLSYDSLFLYDKKLSKEKNWEVKNNLAESYNLGGRLTGKSAISIIIDSAVATFNKVYNWLVISSFDKLHVQEIFEKLINAFENHKILKILNVHSLRSPIYKLNFSNGCLLESVNQNITGKNPGGQFPGKHFDRHIMEESSYITKDVSSKMLMAQAEQGCINRFSGMTTFTKTSPIGEIFFDLNNKKKIINLPSYVNPTWNEKKEADAIKEFGGRDSIGYQVQIEGKVIEGAESVFDIMRVRATYLFDKHGHALPIKAFEVNKESFHRYKEIIILDKPGNAEFTGIYADVGEGGAPSEYIVLFKINKIYRYNYRITTFQLSPEEEREFIEFLIERLEPNVIGLDHTSGVGKALLSSLEKKYREHIVAVDFNSNIEIDFEKDELGNHKFDKNGKPILKEANTVDWSMQCLKDIFYNKKIQCYEDVKFDTQINNVIVKNTNQGKVIYGCKGANHLFQAFQVFAVTNWITEFKNIKTIKPRQQSLGIVLDEEEISNLNFEE